MYAISPLLTKLLQLYLMLLIIMLILALAFLVRYLCYWRRARRAKADISISDMVKLRLAAAHPGWMVEALVVARENGLEVTKDELFHHRFRRGNAHAVVIAMAEAKQAGVPLPFEQAAQIDLAHRDVVKVVRDSITPHTIACPDPGTGNDLIAAETADGVHLYAQAEATVRLNLEHVLHGVDEETLRLRIAEGVRTIIQFASSADQIIANPSLVSRQVIEKRLDTGTGYEIESLDVRIHRRPGF